MNPHIESRDLELLKPDFAKLVKEVIQNCQKRGVTMVPFFTLRGPGTQARLFCQSRTVKLIQNQAALMQRSGAHWLASLMRPDYGTDHPKRNAHVQTNSKVTNAPPGMSWHQYGSAVDCFVHAKDGSAIWNGDHIGYAVYAEEAEKLGLTAGANWKTMPDAVHVQATKLISPLAGGMHWPEIEELMIRKFKEEKS